MDVAFRLTHPDQYSMHLATLARKSDTVPRFAGDYRTVYIMHDVMPYKAHVDMHACGTEA